MSESFPLEFLVGTWEGEGHGAYPTIESFDYREEATFVHSPGRPRLAYGQRTWLLPADTPAHVETGYLRAGDRGHVELVVAHPFGAVEVAEGTVAGGRIEVVSTQVVTTSTAKEVLQVTRTFEVDGDELRYDVHMAAVGVPLTHHLAATLRRR
jgi:hypothetical protein